MEIPIIFTINCSPIFIQIYLLSIGTLIQLFQVEWFYKWCGFTIEMAFQLAWFYNWIGFTTGLVLQLDGKYLLQLVNQLDYNCSCSCKIVNEDRQLLDNNWIVFQLGWFQQLYYSFFPTVFLSHCTVSNKLDPFVRIILSHQNHLFCLDIVTCL